MRVNALGCPGGHEAKAQAESHQPREVRFESYTRPLCKLTTSGTAEPVESDVSPGDEPDLMTVKRNEHPTGWERCGWVGQCPG